MTHTFTSGALIDERTPEQKARDWQQREVLASSAQVQWREKQPNELRKFPIFDQDGSGSCVAQTEAKELGIMRWLTDGTYVHFSATDIYQRRTNRPGGGMGFADARRIAKEGATLEALAPSQGMSDAKMDAQFVEPYKREVGAVFSVPNYLALPLGDIDAAASTIQATGKGLMLWFYFKNDEWTSKPKVLYPGLDLYDAATAKHSATGVDYFIQNNEKCLLIEDSWGPGAGAGGQRIITESFFKARNFYAGYLVRFRFQDAQVPKPTWEFLVDLELGMDGPNVKSLQDCLKWTGDFPTNAESTGYFGTITQAAVQKFQVKQIGVEQGDAGYGRVGPRTREKLNEIFS